jgi:hypothetical protein
VKALEHASFPAIAERVGALYDEEQDALLLAMLGQEYIIHRDGLLLHGQRAPDSHASVILDYIFSSGTALTLMPWRTIGDFPGTRCPHFRKNVELPVAQHSAEVVTRAQAILPMFDGTGVPSLIGSDMAITMRALPRVYLHVEMSQETQEFPPEAWILFSNNANEFLSAENLQALGEIFKDRLLSVLRIY